MIYYKHPLTNDVYAYETEEERRRWGAPELVEMTPEEIEAHLHPPVSLADAQAEVCARIDAERAKLAVEPIMYEGSLFDADATARERISGFILRLLRGDGLPAGWIGWRDATNQIHWEKLDAEAVRVKISGLASAIEDREQALIASAWRHKDTVRALTDVDAVKAYDIKAVGGFDEAGKAAVK